MTAIAALLIAITAGPSLLAQAPAGGGTIGTSACDAPDAHALIQAAIDAAGPGGKVYLPACPAAGGVRRCYRVRASIGLKSRTILEGDGAGSCIEVDTGADSPGIVAKGVEGVVIRNISLHRKEGAATRVGIQLAGDTLDTSHALIENVVVEDFLEANISLRHTYGTTMINVRASATGRNAPLYDVRLEDGYNNVTSIIGGEYKFASEAAIYVGAGGEGLHADNPIMEANEKHGILIKGPFYGIQLNNAYFEQNGAKSNGCDIYVPFAGIYDVPVVEMSIRNASFNTANCTANIENTADLDFSFNVGYPPAPGSAGIEKKNVVVLGRANWRPRITGNRGLNIFNGAGKPVVEFPGNIAENRFLFSEMLSNQAWGEAASRASTDGTSFPDGGAAWKCSFPAPTSAKQPYSFGQTVGSQAGRIVGNGAWMRTDRGTATVLSDIHGTAGYAGSSLNQPSRAYLTTDWKWVWENVTIAAADSGPVFSGWRVYANDGSPTTAIYVYHPQAWVDMVNGPPQYATTGGTPIVMESAGSPRPREGTVTCRDGQHVAAISVSASGALEGVCN